MRILHIAQNLSYAGAGVKVAVEELSREQQERGHVVTVWGVADSFWWNGDGLNWRGAEARVFAKIGPMSFGFCPGMAIEFGREQPDILHIHGLWTFGNVLGLLRRRYHNSKLVVSLHGMLSPVALEKSGGRKKVAWRVYQRKALENADLVHVTSREESTYLEDIPLRRPPVEIPLGTSIPRFAPVEKSTKLSREILYLGRLAPIKGIDRLLKSWNLLEGEFPGWRLAIVGPSEGDYLLKLKLLAEDLGLARIDFESSVSGDEKFRRLSNADIFVLPSHSENFGLTVAESLSVGVPVIVSTGAPWSELESHECGIWTDCDPLQLSSSLRVMMMKTEHERRIMGNKGRDWITAEFSWKAVAGRFDRELNVV